MGIWESICKVVVDIRDAVVGPDKVEAARREKRVAARRRYRANCRRRNQKLALISQSMLESDGVNIVSSSRAIPETFPSVGLEDQGLAALNVSFESADVPGVGDNLSISSKAGDNSTIAVSTYVQGKDDKAGGESVLEFEEQESMENYDNNSELSTNNNSNKASASGHGISGVEAVNLISNSVFEDSVDARLNGDMLAAEEGNDSKGGTENSTADILEVHSVSGESAPDVAGADVVGADFPGADFAAAPVAGSRPEVPLDVDDSPYANIGVQVREMPRIPQRVLRPRSRVPSIIDMIPRLSSSDDSIWRPAKLPDLMGLVVIADDTAKIYVVPRSFFGVQVYTARHLSYRHCVMDLKQDLPVYLREIDPPREVVWYSPHTDHHDDFFVVLNEPNSVRMAIGDDFPLEEVGSYTRQFKCSNGGQASRQQAKLNRGFTGTQSMPTRDENGHPTPTLKEGSRDPIVVATMLRASNYVRSLPVPWNANSPLVVPVQRTALFASRIAEGVLFEGATYTTHQRCNWHRDVQNPPPDETSVSQVTSVNGRLANGGYIVSIFYYRMSISVNLNRNVNGDPIVRHFVETYRGFAPERRQLSYQTIGEGSGFCAVAPNLDPIGFHTLVVVCIVSVLDRFRLNLFECVSLVVAYLQMPNTAEPFSRACIRILQDGRMRNNITGYRVGMMFATWMLKEQRSFNVRFNIYRGDPVLDEETFREGTTSLFWLALHIWSAYPTRPANTIVARAYSGIRDLVKSLFHGVGNLIAMHAIQIMAEIGLLPSWLQHYACFDHNGRVFRWYAEKFSFPSTAVQARRLMSSVPTGMEQYLDSIITEVVLENLACKNFQRAGGGVETRRDVHHFQAPIIARAEVGNGLRIIFRNGEEMNLENDCVVPRWNFGSEDMTMLEIATFLELPRALPGLRSLGSSRLPDEARAHPATSNLPFNMPRWYSAEATDR